MSVSISSGTSRLASSVVAYESHPADVDCTSRIRKHGHVESPAEGAGRKKPKLAVGQAKSKHVKDCRRYRDKMTKKFEELTQTIPGAASDSSVNHRAKVIDHTMQVLQQLLEETNDLQLQLAMTNKRRMSKWIQKSVSSVSDLNHAVTPLSDLFLDKRGWKYAEFWRVHKELGTTTPSLEMTKAQLGRNLSVEERQLFEELESKHGADRLQPESGLLRQAYETFRGQYMQLKPTTSPLDDGKQSPDLEMCLVVPIITIGYVKGIVAFYDTTWREEEAKEGLVLAEEIATVIGNVYGSCCRDKLPLPKKPTDVSTLSTLSSGSDRIRNSSDVKPTKTMGRKGAIPFLLNA